MEFAKPPVNNIKFVLTVQLGDPLISEQNLVILFTGPETIEWNMVKRLVENPDAKVYTRSVSTSPWMYRCCDYSVGAFLGLIEEMTCKKFIKIKCPVDDVGVNYYELVQTQETTKALTITLIIEKELQTT